MKFLIGLFLFLLVAKCFADAMLTEETEAQGMTKQCIYDDYGSTVVITIPATSICPLSIPSR